MLRIPYRISKLWKIVFWCIYHSTNTFVQRQSLKWFQKFSSKIQFNFQHFTYRFKKCFQTNLNEKLEKPFRALPEIRRSRIVYYLVNSIYTVYGYIHRHVHKHGVMRSVIACLFKNAISSVDLCNTRMRMMRVLALRQRARESLR